MSTNWCANFKAHADKTKRGQKPTFPKGKCRVHYDLAAFLTNTSGMSFNEDDFLCTCCYQLAKNSFSQFNSIAASKSMDTDNFRPERAAAVTALSNISTLTNAIKSSSDYEDSSSDMSDEETMNLNSQLNQKESTELLNRVFALVGQSPIRDIRNRNILRQKANDTLRIIRQAAEKVFEGKEEELLIDNTMIRMDEATELINNFKYLIDTSDYSETIKLLTLAPKSWGRLKVQNFFSCSDYQARYSIYLRDAGQILTLPVDFRGNTVFDPVIEKEIFDFFHSDEISRVLYLRTFQF